MWVTCELVWVTLETHNAHMCLHDPTCVSSVKKLPHMWANVWNWNNRCGSHVNTCGPHVDSAWFFCKGVYENLMIGQVSEKHANDAFYLYFIYVKCLISPSPWTGSDSTPLLVPERERSPMTSLDDETDLKPMIVVYLLLLNCWINRSLDRIARTTH